jgi:membrane protein DedA with SNARE-associated domain
MYGSESLMEFILTWVTQYGYIAIFTLLTLGIVGVPVPDETLLVFTGYLIFRHELEPVPAFLAAFLGSIGGVSLSYTLGRTLGHFLVARFGRHVHLTPAKLDQVRAWYDRHGRYALVIGYFIPGIRHLGAYVAGTSKLPLPTFAAFAYPGGLLWSASFVTLGYLLGEEWQQISASVHYYALIGAGALLIVTVVVIVRARWRRSPARRSDMRPL